MSEEAKRGKEERREYIPSLHPTFPHHKNLFPLSGKGLERFHDYAGVVAVVNVNGGTAHPVLKVVDGERDILREVFVENLRKMEGKICQVRSDQSNNPL